MCRSFELICIKQKRIVEESMVVEYMHPHTYTHPYKYTCVFKYINIQTNIHVQIHICKNRNTHTYIHTHVLIHANIFFFCFSNIRKHIYVWKMYTYTHTYECTCTFCSKHTQTHAYKPVCTCTYRSRKWGEVDWARTGSDATREERRWRSSKRWVPPQKATFIASTSNSPFSLSLARGFSSGTMALTRVDSFRYCTQRQRQRQRQRQTEKQGKRVERLYILYNTREEEEE